jgi:HK97 family phage portal protein
VVNPENRFTFLSILDAILNRFGYSRTGSSPILTPDKEKLLSPGSIPGGPVFTTVIYPGWKTSPTSAFFDDADPNKDQQVAEYKGLIYDAINRIASAGATANYRMVDEDGEPIENHPFLQVLAEPFGNKATVSITSNDLFYTMFLDLLIFGNSIWLVNAINKQLSQILPLSPQLVTPKLDTKTGFVDGYIWGEGTRNPIIYKADEIIHMQYVDPEKGKRFIWGKSPIEAHKDLIEIYNKELELQKDALDKGGLPAVIAKVDGAKTGDTHQNALERYREMIENKFFNRKEKVAVIDAELMDITTLEAKLDQMGFTGIKELTIREIASMYGIDPMFLGLTQTTNRAQAEAAIFLFEKYALKPILDKVQAQLNQDLVRYAYGPNQFFEFFDVVTPDQESLRADLGLMFDKGAATPNEIRVAMGFEPISEPAMDRTYLPFSLVPTSFAGESQQQTEDEEETIEIVDDEQKFIIVPDQPENELIIISNGKQSPETIARQRRGWQRLFSLTFNKAEPDYLANLRKFFNTQMNGVDSRLRESEKLSKGQILLNTKQTDDEIDAILDFILFDIDQATEATIKAMTKPIGAHLLLTGEAHIQAMDLPIDFNDVSPSLLELLDTGGKAEGVFKFADEINITTDQQLRKTLREGIKAGETIDQLSERIAAVKVDAQGFRAVRIARTEIIGGYSRAANTTVTDTVNEFGGTPMKWWYTAGPAERHTHNANERESFDKNGLPLDQAFKANGLLYPGDPNGEAGEIINCKCVPGHIIEGLGA